MRFSWRSVLVGVATSLALCGCGAATDTQHPSQWGSDADDITQDEHQIDAAQDKWLKVVNACQTDTPAQVIRCVDRADESSQFTAAADKLRIQLERTRDQLDDGDCRTATNTLVTKLRLLSQALDTFRTVATTGTWTATKTAGAAANSAYAAVIPAAGTSRKACT